MDRIEVHYANGEFRAYPNVRNHKKIEDRYNILFGKDETNLHTAVIFLDKVNWLEVMEEKEES